MNDTTLAVILRNRFETYRVLGDEPVIQEFVQRLLNQLGDAVQAVVLYGSSLRSRDFTDGLLDFYVVLDRYTKAFSRRSEAVANQCLPPNVYYLRFEKEGGIYQGKYATVTLGQLNSRVQAKSLHPYFWARFCQPMAIVYARDENSRDALIGVQEKAVHTFIRKIVPTLRGPVNSGRQIWERGFQLTYRSELRAESSSRAAVVYEYDRQNYDSIYNVLSREPSMYSLIRSTSNLKYKLALSGWWLRIAWGKIVSILRLVKAVFTFSNGIEYAVWKVERHRHVKFVLTERARKHPLIFGWPLLFRLLRSGLVR